MAALQAYEDENLIERSRLLGQRMFAALNEMQSRQPLIGDVRGGHGLFAVVELVADRETRAPLAPWPRMAPSLKHLLQQAMELGVSFAARGNLLILAPPLVIERERTGRRAGVAGSPARRNRAGHRRGEEPA